MSKLDKLEIIVGTVVEVQITERLMEPARAAPAPTDGRRGRKPRPQPAAAPATIIGRQRVFIDGPGAKDPHYDFDRCELAVRREQEIAVARIPARRKRHGPINVMLLNRTMDESWPFDSGIAALAPPPTIEVRTKALVSAIASFAVLYLAFRFVIMPQGSAVWWITWPALCALVLYFVFWGGLIFYRGYAQRARRAKLITALHQKLKAAPVDAAGHSHPQTATEAGAPQRQDPQAPAPAAAAPAAAPQSPAEPPARDQPTQPGPAQS